MLHVGPEAYSVGEILPHALVFPDAFLTLLDERLHAVFFDLVFAVQAQLFLHFQLNGQAVGIPAGFPGHVEALHAAVPGDHVLDDPGQHMTDVGLAVGCGRSVIEGINRRAFPVFYAFFENPVVFPELSDFFFSFNEIQTGVYFTVHHFPPVQQTSVRQLPFRDFVVRSNIPHLYKHGQEDICPYLIIFLKYL